MTAAPPTLFVSLFAYAAHKHCECLGRSWAEWLTFWRENPATCPWRGFRTLGHARALGGETVLDYVNGSTLITKARSRASGIFLATTSADVWLTIDDDIEASADVVHRLILAARETRGVVSAPCVLRSGSAMNYVLRDEETSPSAAGTLAHASRTGLGLAAMHRAAVEAAARAAAWVLGDDGVRYPALFREKLTPIAGPESIGLEAWVSEDYAFSDLVLAAGGRVDLLLDAPTDHAGRPAKVARDLTPCVFVAPKKEKLP